MQAAANKPPALLPVLRPELRLLPGETLPGGAPSKLLFDPVRNAYHRLEKAAWERLSRWKGQSVDAYLSEVNGAFETQTTEEDVESLAAFLYAQNLVIHPPGGDSEQFAAREFASKPPLSQILIHKYLFFRIPLVRPDRFLKFAYPFVAWMFTRLWLWTVVSLGGVGLIFAARQWDEFITTFLHFLTFEGFVFYGLTLAGLKIIHELGHAFTARHFGSKVPVMGLAFLVMFPILYTDTTNAWELTDRRKRVLIDAAGMLAELMMACLAIFAWSFLPDGPLRSAAFFTATTSWTLSLLVNLNPMMRFDGYYLLTDLFRAPNLQKTGFDYGRWVMRERLFGLGRPRPFNPTGMSNTALLTYAWCTWVYRFFLFIGIAILVHAVFPKAIGIVLFIVEIGFFIALPILKELKEWWSFKMTIISTRRGRTTLALTAIALAVALIPWQSTVRAPAIMRPALQTEIFPLAPARLVSLRVNSGQSVSAGDVIAVLHSSGLDQDERLTQQTLALTRARLSRRGSDAPDLSESAVLLESEQRDISKLAGIDAARKALIIRAPHAGIISDMRENLHIGRYVGVTDRLARLSAPGATEIIAFPKEADAARLKDSEDLKFIPDDLMAPAASARITGQGLTGELVLKENIVSGAHRGPIAVTEDEDGNPVPTTAIFRMTARTDDAQSDLRAVRGVAIMTGKRQSPATRVFKRIGQVLIRETDF